jgi:hypothetical protein
VEDLRVAPVYPQVLEEVQKCGFKSLHAELQGEMPKPPTLRQQDLF